MRSNNSLGLGVKELKVKMLTKETLSSETITKGRIMLKRLLKLFPILTRFEGEGALVALDNLARAKSTSFLYFF